MGIYEVEIHDRPDLNEIRILELQKLENQLREVLKQISFEEELFHLSFNLQEAEKENTNSLSPNLEYIKEKKEEVTRYLSANGITDPKDVK